MNLHLRKILAITSSFVLFLSAVREILKKFDLQQLIANFLHIEVKAPEGGILIVNSSVSGSADQINTDGWDQPVSQPRQSLRWLHPALKPCLLWT